MAHDVFISYSSHDKVVADAVCAALEGDGVRCWVAPRDILAGQDWGGAIVEAIRKCRVLVLIFSGRVNDSQQVRREVQLAFDGGAVVVPLRIENVRPADALKYYLDGVHWLDAMPPLERHLAGLGGTVRQLLAARPVAGGPVAALPLGYDEQGSGRNGGRGKGPGRRGLWRAGWAALAALALGAGLWWAAYRRPAMRAGGPAAVASRIAGPATAPAGPTTAAVDALFGERAVAEILDSLRLMDFRLGLVLKCATEDPSEPALKAVEEFSGSTERVPLRTLDGVIFLQIAGQAEEQSANRREVLQALGATAEAAAALVNTSPHPDLNSTAVSNRTDLVIRGRRRAKLGMNLKLCDAPDEESRQWVLRDVAAAIEQRRVGYLTTHARALRVLQQVRPSLPPDVAVQLAGLKYLEPRQLITDSEAVALIDRLAADAAKADRQLKEVDEEGKQVRLRQGEAWSERLQSPSYKLSAWPAKEILNLLPLAVESTQEDGSFLEPSNSPTVIVGKVRDDREGDPLRSVLCFYYYAALFAESQPWAEDYARAGAQLTLQIRRFDVKGGLYLYDLPDGPVVGPARQAGLREGDVLTAYNGQATMTDEDLSAALKAAAPGEPARVEYLRKDDKGRFTRSTATIPRGGSLGAAFMPI